jgi:hypothetical protein
MSRESHSAGKGWKPRPVSENFGKEMDRIFGPKEIKTWNPDEEEKEQTTESGESAED